ncbi:MAG: hypothetical protein WC462_00690 [archaeon]
MSKKEIVKKNNKEEVVSEKPVMANQSAKDNKTTLLLSKSKKPFVSNKKLLFLVAGIVVLLVFAWVFFVFLPNYYRFSFPIDGLNYYSNYYTPSEFFELVRDSNSVVVSTELVDNELDVWAVNARQLWIVGLIFDKKEVLQVVKSVDSFGNLQYCSMNDFNVLQERKLSAVECNAFFNDSNYLSINIRRSSENKVVLGRNSADIFALKGESMTWVNYSVIKNVYSNFDQILAIFQEKKNSFENSIDMNQSK